MNFKKIGDTSCKYLSLEAQTGTPALKMAWICLCLYTLRASNKFWSRDVFSGGKESEHSHEMG